jgi:hypothetical protein
MLMAKRKKNVRRISDKKVNRPKVRFNIWMLIIIFFLSFAGCFVLYMVAANLDEDFFSGEYSTIIEESEVSEDENTDTDSDSVEEDDTTEEEQVVIQNPVPQSETVDVSYLDSCCLVTDSTLFGMNGVGFSDVIGSSELTAANVNTTKVASSYGTVTVYETLKIKKPVTVYMMLGSDIGVSSVDEMISEYMTLLNNLRASLPDMKIYVMQLPPVFDDADKNALINEYNNRLLELANSIGVYCIDTNTEFKDNDGNLKEEYKNIVDEYYNYTYADSYANDIKGYILTHTA